MSFNGSYYDPSLLSTDSTSERSGRPAGPRRNSSSIPPPQPLGLPEGRTPPGSAQSSVSGRPRSRSPLRKAVTMDADRQFPDARNSTRGSIDSSRQSLSDFASSFLKVGSNIMGGSATPSNASGRQSPNKVARKPVPQSPSSVLSRLTDAELEEQAIREKEASRREAERILTQEADQRRRADERVLASLRPTNGSEASAVSPVGSYSDLPPTNGHMTPRKESGNSGNGWMSALAKKLTPTKDVTPAQQIINDMKAKDKEQEKEQKRAAKDKRKSQPGTPEPKNTDPAYLNLTQPISIPGRSSPSAYSPLPGGSPGRMSANTGYSAPMTPTPQRTHGPPGSSPILGPTEPTPLYAVFNPQGTLDIPATLLTVAKRFEKLEKWTVSHVRALEERMKDVEKYLIDRESDEKPDSLARKQLEDMKKEMTNLQILLLETHTDLAELKNQPPVIHQTTVVQQVAPPPPQAQPSPSPPSSRPSPRLPDPEPKTPAKAQAPLPEEEAPVMRPLRGNVTGESITPSRSLPQPPRPASAASSAFSGRAPNGHSSPNVSSTPPLNGKPSRSRLPYPSGDYTSGFSQPGSPSQFSSPGQVRRQTTGGTQSHDRSGSEYSIPERYRSPSPPTPHRQQASYDLAPPKTPSNANSSARATSKSPSPTPRKRYTVALSGREDVPSPNNATRGEGEVQTALFSDSPGGSRAHSLEETGERMVGMFDFSPLVIGKHGREASDRTDITATPPNREETQSPDPTIGGTSITLSRLPASPPPATGRTMSPKPSMGRPRSMYSMNSISPSLKTVSSPQTVPSTQTSPRTSSLRARAQSTFSSLDSVSNELNGKSPALGAPAQVERQGRPTTTANGRPTHKRAQSQGIGLGINTRDVDTGSDSGPRSAMPASSKRQSTIVTPSGQPFVDPLVIRKKSKTNLQGTTTAAPNVLKKTPGSKVPVGALVAFFDEKQGQ
ncbi:hypothetical protein FS837_011159 [Tulasnella sp. UAMH 9824]|nr:hypothetical protein FS837_011159 [Tulasnella sp. UAMH 9824]